MRYLAIFVFSIVGLGVCPLTFAKDKLLKVMFYKVQATTKNFPEMACRAYYHDMEFKNNGKIDLFPRQANPRFYNHRLVATLELKPGIFLQQVALDGDFSYQGKLYKLHNIGSSITYMEPTFVKGVISNEYCRAAYIVVDNNADLLGKYTKI